MLGIAILVFREVLEAALVVSVVFAATRGVPGRGRWIGAGIAAGVLGSIAVALSAGVIADAAAGMGQELFNATRSVCRGGHDRLARDLDVDSWSGTRPAAARRSAPR